MDGYLNMKIVDVEKWDRKVPYENFITYTNPIFSLTATIDVTKLYAYGKTYGRSFFIDFLYIALRSINEIEQMRIRLCGDDVVIFDKIDASFIVMNNDGVINTCNVGYDKNYNTFYDKVSRAIEIARKTNQEKFNDVIKTDLIYVSAIKWLDFTSMSNPYDFNNKEACSIPRITWGKITDKDGRKNIPLDIAAHHALVDGYPVATVFEKIQKYIDEMNFTAD